MSILYVFLGSLIFSFIIIKVSLKHKLFQPNNTYLLEIHSKKLVPTMGGVAILLATNLYCIFFRYDIPILLLGNSFAVIGLVDDVLKLKKKTSFGWHMKYRIICEILFAGIFVAYTIFLDPTRNYVPLVCNLLKQPIVLSQCFVICQGVYVLSLIWGVWTIISAANGVNLTDGVDSLASTLAIYALFFVTYKTGAQLPLVLIAAILGYLFFNWPPAKIFMGDTGSLALGSLIGALFYKYHLEMFLPFVGIVFVIEVASTILQIFYIRVLNKRLFLMAPLHHNFEALHFKKSTILLGFNAIGLTALLIACLL